MKRIETFKNGIRKQLGRFTLFLFPLFLGFSGFLGACGREEAHLLTEAFQQETGAEAAFDGTKSDETGGEANPVEPESEASGSEREESAPSCCVYVCGAVGRPDLYSFEEGERVAHVLERAGGLTEQAAKEALNLAEPLRDGAMIYVPDQAEWEERKEQARGAEIPTFGQNADLRSGADPSQSDAGARININTADQKLLETLPGIGAQKAERILRYRSEHGGFKNVEEMKQVPGIKDKGFEKIRDRIVTE